MGILLNFRFRFCMGTSHKTNCPEISTPQHSVFIALYFFGFTRPSPQVGEKQRINGGKPPLLAPAVSETYPVLISN